MPGDDELKFKCLIRHIHFGCPYTSWLALTVVNVIKKYIKIQSSVESKHEELLIANYLDHKAIYYTMVNYNCNIPLFQLASIDSSNHFFLVIQSLFNHSITP